VKIWDLRKRSAPMFQLEGHSISFVPSLQFDSQKLIFSAIHHPPNQYFWQSARERNPFRYHHLCLCLCLSCSLVPRAPLASTIVRLTARHLSSRHQMLHVWNARTFEFWNSLDFSKVSKMWWVVCGVGGDGWRVLINCIIKQECAEATSPMSFDFADNFLVVGVPRQVVMLNFYNNAHSPE
jgi:hypothetical protein